MLDAGDFFSVLAGDGRFLERIIAEEETDDVLCQAWVEFASVFVELYPLVGDVLDNVLQ
ncbi:hypothetical protein ACFQY7_20480 [Actinomadura luteofluorescens]|uniref:Uncharacterized protein n=1 Tax=Actinomadura luteofluorescens TaxID=46163 RepID=A0A7Y9EP44_9ACTN|nr:hypothetical protein [Actinomadura luteofluorescens]NYD51341.1 hypothetical protein [Actinomadura luteofluorescens]